jgi:predicted nucleic-acid-binding Zn-ribbon protein
MGNLEDQIGARFKCSKCKNSSSNIRRFAATGSGLSRFVDWQHNEFIAVSCDRCGFTDIYDPSVFKDKGRVTEILDLLFGLGD